MKFTAFQSNIRIVMHSLYKQKIHYLHNIKCHEDNGLYIFTPILSFTFGCPYGHSELKFHHIVILMGILI